MTVLTAEPSSPVFHLRRPEDLVALAPHLLGFQPRDSLVLVIVSGRAIVLTARFDLAAVTAARPGDWLEPVLELGLSRGGDRVLGLVYGGGEPLRQTWDRLGDWCQTMSRRQSHGSGDRTAFDTTLLSPGLGHWLDLCLVVDPETGQWWDAAGGGPGRPPPDDRARSWAADCGLEPVRPSREALGHDLAGPQGDLEDAMVALWSQVVTGAVGPADPLAAAWADPAGPWSPADYLAAAVAVHDPKQRDRLWRGLTRANAGRQVVFWRAVVGHVPQAYRVVPLAVLGLIAWVAGEGVLLSLCHQECRRLNPEAPVVPLLTTICRSLAHPDAWEEILATLAGPSPDDEPDGGGAETA
ncbi:MAG: DUF4192 domain-containing protein [Propionibacteriaceae bacterium]|jgi:hypothetical protein|nr:DUF4192 domain-containing protein [Propionibacteriaceae bacterium]